MANTFHMWIYGCTNRHSNMEFTPKTKPFRPPLFSSIHHPLCFFVFCFYHFLERTKARKAQGK